MKSTDTLVTWLAFLGLSAAAVLAVSYAESTNARPAAPPTNPAKPDPTPAPPPAPPRKACKAGCGCNKTTGHCCCSGQCSSVCRCGPDCDCGGHAAVEESPDGSAFPPGSCRRDCRCDGSDHCVCAGHGEKKCLCRVCNCQHPPVIGGGPTQEGGKTSPDGSYEVVCDLPQSEKKHNVGGRDGAGLCVFTSIEYAGRWQNERRLWDLQAKMRQEPGGGYPEKVDAMLKKYAPGVNYLQDTSGNEALLKAALAAGRMPGVTYDGHDCHYSGSIGHMVDLVGLNDRWAVISDNNFPADGTHTWMSPQDFYQRWKGNQGGWAFILLNPTPPPPPHAARK